MKSKIIYASFLAFFSLLLSHSSYAQATFANNLPGANRFLGFDGAQNLEFRTNNNTRMQMMQNGNSTINGALVNRSGFLGLSQEPTCFGLGVASPFSKLI